MSEKIIFLKSFFPPNFIAKILELLQVVETLEASFGFSILKKKKSFFSHVFKIHSTHF